MCIDKTVTEISYNWGYNELGEWCSRFTVGKEYLQTDEKPIQEFVEGTARPGATINAGCKEIKMTKCLKIEEHRAAGDGDKWFYDVHFENGKIVRVFNPNTVEFKTGK